PKLHFISGFSDHPALLEAFAEKGKEYALEDYDHILFSYHGLPKRQIRKGDLTGTCLKVPDCCRKNRRCYAAQCLMTTEGIARRLSLTAKRWTQTYQSRLGKEPWLRPYTGEVLQALAKRGIKKVLVFCPAFVCDCLETLEEISSQYKNEFLSAGGESLDLVEGLNDSAPWIEALERIVRDETSRAYV
ncbi:MAG: ferrochelatase, partial [Chlamydiia bacterium]|nr:ferrochelatase [Chlamydiia bacterium]